MGDGRSILTPELCRITDRLKDVPDADILRRNRTGLETYSEEERQAEFLRRRLNYLLSMEVRKMRAKGKGDKA